MKRAISALGLALVLAIVVAAQSKPDFSGKWILDVAKSDFGPAPPLEAMSHEIQHKDPTVKIVTTQKSAQGELANQRTITTDGKENSNRLKTMMGDQDVTSTSRWDGPKLTTAMKLDVAGTPVSISDVWELSADGKVLTITRRTTTPEGDITQKFVFNKQ